MNTGINNEIVAKRHFHTFDALRFFACFKVFLHHLPIEAFPWFSFIKKGGGIGVQFFFVLSGFLITYIICEEKQRTGNLDLRNFFARRVLRIWPLFYLMIGVAFLTPILLDKLLHLNSSASGYDPDWKMSVLFLENYKMMATRDTPNVSPLGVMWSLCIEEHFYIVWGLLLYFVSLKRLPVIIISCIVIGLAGRFIYASYGIPTADIVTNIDLFAFGAIPAILLISKPVELVQAAEPIPMWVKQFFVLLLLVIVLVCSQARGDGQYILITTLLGFMFALLIMLTLPERTGFKINDGSLLSKLGIYTYGFYLYHTLVINLFKRVFEKYNISLDNPGSAIVFVVITFLFSLVASWLSYRFFEKPFLRLKKYFRQ